GAIDTSAQTSGDLRLSLDARLRWESWDWFGGTEQGQYAFLGGFFRAGVAQQGPRFGWQIDLAAPFLHGLPTDAVRPAPEGQLGIGAAYFAANDGDESGA